MEFIRRSVIDIFVGGMALDNNNEKDYMEIDLAEIVGVLWGNFRNILVVTICCVLVSTGWLFARRAAPVYESEACLQVKQVQQVFSGGDLRGSDAKSLIVNTYPYGDGLSTVERMQTCAEMLKSRSVLQLVTDALGETGVVTAEPIKNTRLLKVKFTAGSPGTSKKGNELLIQAFQAYMAGRGQYETRYITGGRPTESNTGAASSAVEAVVVSHNEVEIVDAPTLPTEPVATHWNRILAGSVLLGLFLGSGYAVMKAIADRRLMTERDVEDYLGLVVIGIVPEKASLEETMTRRGQKSVWRQIGGLLWK